MVLLSREDIFSSRENLSLNEEELDVNRLDYYQVRGMQQTKKTRKIINNKKKLQYLEMKSHQP